MAASAGVVPTSPIAVPVADHLAPLQLPGILDAYRMQQMLGTGTFAEVWSAQRIDTETKPYLTPMRQPLPRRIAFKLFKAARLKDPQHARMIQSEIAFLGQLRHPHIVRMFGFEHTPSKGLCVALELANGSLYSLVRRQKRLAESDLKPLFAQLVSALLYLHETCGCVHRDLKVGGPSFITIRRQ
jgi:serine/threonine-protein kinase Stk1